MLGRVCLGAVRGLTARAQVGKAPATSSSRRPPRAKCWQCSAWMPRHPVVFCSACSAIQYPDPRLDYFGLLGLKKTFDLDLDRLAGSAQHVENRLVQAVIRGGREAPTARHYLDLLQSAKMVLADPLYRGVYLLQLQGAKDQINYIRVSLIREIIDFSLRFQVAASKAELNGLLEEALRQSSESSAAATFAFEKRDYPKVTEALERTRFYSNMASAIKKRATAK